MRIIQFTILFFTATVSIWAADPVTGSWSGVIHVSNTDLRLVLHVKDSSGKLQATFDSPDQYVAGMPVDKIVVKGQQLTFEIVRIASVYSGTLSKDGKTITGSWSQLGASFPVNFQKAAQVKK